MPKQVVSFSREAVSGPHKSYTMLDSTRTSPLHRTTHRTLRRNSMNVSLGMSVKPRSIFWRARMPNVATTSWCGIACMPPPKKNSLHSQIQAGNHRRHTISLEFQALTSRTHTRQCAKFRLHEEVRRNKLRFPRRRLRTRSHSLTNGFPQQHGRHLLGQALG